jgi:hypothetical protein
MGIIRRMGKEGDVPTKWEFGDVESTKVAEERFAEGIKRGMLAFNLDKPSEPGEAINAFDPSAREIVLIPQIAGG